MQLGGRKGVFWLTLPHHTPSSVGQGRNSNRNLEGETAEVMEELSRRIKRRKDQIHECPVKQAVFGGALRTGQPAVSPKSEFERATPTYLLKSLLLKR